MGAEDSVRVGAQPRGRQARVPAYLPCFPMETVLVPAGSARLSVRGRVPSPRSARTRCPISPRFPRAKASPAFAPSAGTPTVPGRGLTGAQPFTSHRRSPSGERTPGKLPVMLVPCHPGGDTRGKGHGDPTPCPWRRSLP